MTLPTSLSAPALRANQYLIANGTLFFVETEDEGEESNENLVDLIEFETSR